MYECRRTNAASNKNTYCNGCLETGSLPVVGAKQKEKEMKIQLEIWHKDTFVKVDVSLKRIKGTPELRKYGRQIVENGKYVPYWFEGYGGKDFILGGHYNYDYGLINLKMGGNNVQGVVLNGNEVYELESVTLAK